MDGIKGILEVVKSWRIAILHYLLGHLFCKSETFYSAFFPFQRRCRCLSADGMMVRWLLPHASAGREFLLAEDIRVTLD